MKNRIIARISVLLLWLVIGAIVVQAQENTNSVYKIKNFSDTSILIGRQRAERGCVFNGIENIHWSNSKELQYLIVFDCKKKDIVYIVYYPNTREVEIIPESKLCSENGVSEVKLFSESETNSKGWDDDGAVKFDTVGWLRDTLLIPGLKTNSSVDNITAIAYFGNDSIVSAISKTKDGTKYIIPRRIIGKHDKPFYLDIIEKDIDKNWEYAVWRKLYVIPLPLKIE